MNNWHTNIKFIQKSSQKSVPFSDLYIKLSEGKLTLANRHRYLYYTLSHPDTTKRLIVYIQVVAHYMFQGKWFSNVFVRSKIIVSSSSFPLKVF